MLSDDFSGIQKVLPHRYPFLLLDRVICLDLEHEEGPCVTALKNVTANGLAFGFPEATSVADMPSLED